MILIRILVESFRWKFIRWLCNSSRILIRILVWKYSCLFFDQNSSQKQLCNFSVSWFYVFLIEFENDRRSEFLSENAAGYFLIRIPGEEISSEFFKNQVAVEFFGNSSRILIRILVGTFRVKYITQRLTNSSRILIRILVENAADCRIPGNSWEFLWNIWLEFQLIINSAKSADCV